MYSFYDMLPYAQMGGGANAQQQQIMQIIQAYAQIAGVDPRQIMQQLQQMQPQQQQQVLQKMMQAVQQASQSQQFSQDDADMDNQPQMKMGGGAPCYECGGKYSGGGNAGPKTRDDKMTMAEMLWYDQEGGYIPALPVGPYNLPTYNDGSTATGYGQNMAMFEYGGYMDPAWKKAGGIHIKPENRGKFTASANRAGMGVQEFARHVLANKEDYSSTQVKRANFARNAAKWKHQDGGLTVGQEMEATPELLAWLDANGYTYEHL